MTDLKIGRVTHYYDKIKVAVLDLNTDVGKGDKIKFVRGGEYVFKQTIDSLQIDHEKVTSARAGSTVGIKTKKRVKEGTDVFKVF